MNVTTKTKIAELFGDKSAKPRPESRIYISAVGNIVSVRRSVYINKRLARERGVSAGQHSRYIYSFPQSLDKVPALDEGRYHKTDALDERLTDMEREKLVRWFDRFKREQFDREALALRELHDYDKEPVEPRDASLAAADAMKSYQKQLHMIARSIDLVEAGARDGLCPPITPKEAERLYQAWQRIYRRLERMGYKQRMFDAQLQVSRLGSPDVRSDLFKAIEKHGDAEDWAHLITKSEKST